jgi:hypothetical protein
MQYPNNIYGRCKKVNQRIALFFYHNFESAIYSCKKLIREIIGEVMLQIFSAKQLWGRNGRIITYCWSHR